MDGAYCAAAGDDDVWCPSGRVEGIMALGAGQGMILIVVEAIMIILGGIRVATGLSLVTQMPTFS